MRASAVKMSQGKSETVCVYAFTFFRLFAEKRRRAVHNVYVTRNAKRIWKKASLRRRVQYFKYSIRCALQCAQQ